MEKILSQEEIDQLFRAARGTAAPASASPSRNVKQCDFRQSGQLTKEQVRQVTLLHEAFVPSLANSLSAYLRVAFQNSLVAVEQLIYGGGFLWVRLRATGFAVSGHRARGGPSLPVILYCSRKGVSPVADRALETLLLREITCLPQARSAVPPPLEQRPPHCSYSRDPLPRPALMRHPAYLLARARS